LVAEGDHRAGDEILWNIEGGAGGLRVETGHLMRGQAQQVDDGIQSTAAVSEETAASAEEVSASTEEQTASVEQMSAGAQELAALATGLQELVAGFTFGAADAMKTGPRTASARQTRAA